MRKTFMLFALALALTVWAAAQDTAKQDMKTAGSDTAAAAKSVGSAVKSGAVATKNAVTNKTEAARDEAAEATVHITAGPNVTTSPGSATIAWQTNKVAATDVWLTGGGIRGHRTKYVRGGARNHSVTFANLKPNTSYNYEIRTREGGDRRSGSFTTK